MHDVCCKYMYKEYTINVVQYSPGKNNKLLWIHIERSPILKRCIKVHNTKVFVLCTFLRNYRVRGLTKVQNQITRLIYSRRKHDWLYRNEHPKWVRNWLADWNCCVHEDMQQHWTILYYLSVTEWQYMVVPSEWHQLVFN